MHISSVLHKLNCARNSFLVFRWFCISTILLLSPAYGIRITTIQHVFDIKHNFQQPSDVSVSKDGVIYVVDGVNNSIEAFDKNGNYMFSFGGKGSSGGKLLFPLGIDVDITGRIYVADSGNHRVQVFNAKGEYLYQIRIPGLGEKAPDPTDVVVDNRAGRLYVVDNDNHFILAYALSSRKLIQQLGSPGTKEREFRYPFQITIDKNGYLYIVDVINTRVQVMNQEGKFVNFIGGWGVEKGEFFRPKGVAIDQKGRIFVSDSYMGVIQLFRSNGEFYSAVGDLAGKRIKKFKTPTGIYIDNKSRLYVVEMFAEKVSVYEIKKDVE